MPALVAFGRKWEIGSDDLVYPGLRDLFIRLPWLIVTIAIYWKNGTDLSCPGKEDIQIFIYGALAILHLMIIADLALVYNSMKGGIMDTHARRFVPYVIYLRLLFQVTELGWITLGTTWAMEGRFDCAEAQETLTVIEGLIICNWIVILLQLLFWTYQYDPFGNSSSFNLPKNYDPVRDPFPLPLTRRTQAWEKKCRLICCFAGKEASSKEMQAGFQEIGRTFSYLFNDRGLVFSDVIAGLVILGVKTRELRKRRRLELPTPFSLSSSINFDQRTGSIKLPVTDDWNSIRRIMYIYRYALAIHTIPAVTCYNRSNFCCVICRNLQCCNCLPGRKKYTFQVDSDTCCYSKTAAVRSFVDAEDLVYASFNNTNFLCPFYVALDHKNKKIVLVIRGTFSVIDFVIDGICVPEPFETPGIPATFRAHRGMLTSAKLIKKKLDELGILEHLKRSHTKYELLLTGISLGASIVTLLGMLLKEEYPNLKVIAFSPSGALLSAEAAQYCEDFVVAITYGDDMVPRLSMKSLYNLVTEIGIVLPECKVPKYQLQMGIGLLALNIRQLSMDYVELGTAEVSESAVPNHSAVGDDGSQILLFPEKGNPASACDKSLDDETGHLVLDMVPEMFVPGRILYVTQTPLYYKGKGYLSHPNGPRWEIKWADKWEFQKMIVSKRMLHDHIPFRLMRAMTYFSQFEEDTPHNGSRQAVVVTQP